MYDKVRWSATKIVWPPRPPGFRPASGSSLCATHDSTLTPPRIPLILWYASLAVPSADPLVQLAGSRCSAPFRFEVRLDQPASCVELLGEMGDWLTPRRLQGHGSRFAIDLSLPPGVYSYKLRVDGCWVLDPGNPRTRSLRGVRNSVLVVGGAPEPVLFAPALPFVFVGDDGLMHVVAALRKGAGDALCVRWAEDADTVDHLSAMQLVAEEDEHLVFRTALPVSTANVRLRFDLPGGEMIGAGSGSDPFVVARHTAHWPSWWAGAVVYTIFVDRFRPAVDHPHWEQNPGIDAPAGGHLDGIRRSLPELRDLGVNVLYLTPIHVAATCHRYDVVDPFRVDPALGGEESFRALIDQAHAMDMRILLDFSFAHVGRGFPPLEDVLAHGRASRFAAWFQWTGDDRSALRQYGRRTDAPLLDLDHPEVRDMVVEAARHWARFGVDGFRLDAAAEVPHDLARRVRETLVAERPGSMVLGEVVPAHAWRWRQERAVDVASDFGFQAAVTQYVAQRSVDASEMARRLMESSILRGGPSTASWTFLSTHDHARFATLARLHGDPGRTPLGLLLLVCCPGVPGILYGEEVGLASDVVELLPEHAWQDRAPMPWDRASRDERLRSLVKRLLSVRARSRALQRGSLSIVFAEGPWLVMRRQAGAEVVDIAVNASDEAVELDLEDDRLDVIEPLVEVGQVRVAGQTVALGANGGLVARRSMSHAAARCRREFDGNAALVESEFRAGVCEVRSRPRRLDFSLTERCNLRCLHCINESPSRTQRRIARMMTEGVIDRLRGDLAFADYFGFVHGGESLASPLFFPLLEAIRQEKRGSPYVVHLLSNGMMLTREAVSRFVSLGGNSISVSLDGASASTNDSVRAGGRFDVIVANLRDVVRLRNETHADLRIGISSVVMTSNLGELGRLADLAADLGVDWIKFEELVSRGPFAAALMPDEMAARAAVRAAADRARSHGLVAVEHDAPPPVWRCKLDENAGARAFLEADEFANRSRIDPCRAPWELACIDPNGDVRMVDFWGPVLGNLVEDTLVAVWSSPTAAVQRQRHKLERPCGISAPRCAR